jgi:ADP-ribosylglycohydrolase
MEERYIACMLLSGVGDAMGYHGARWEFCRSGEIIHKEVMELTNGQGVKFLHLFNPDFIQNNGRKSDEWVVSDDTVMHLATADG